MHEGIEAKENDPRRPAAAGGDNPVSLHCGASTQACYFVDPFRHVPPAVGLLLQLLCSPIGNGKFQKNTKQNITTEWTPHNVYTVIGIGTDPDLISLFLLTP